MTIRTCMFSGCQRSVDLPDVILTPPEGWRYIWTSGDDLKIGYIEEGLYCEQHAEEIDRRMAQAHSHWPRRAVHEEHADEPTVRLPGPPDRVRLGSPRPKGAPNCAPAPTRA